VCPLIDLVRRDEGHFERLIRRPQIAADELASEGVVDARRPLLRVQQSRRRDRTPVLRDLAHHGLLRRLTRINPPARHRPATVIGPSHEQHLA
jgi:hypothetical protein